MLPRKVLIVDDNVLICWGLFRTLSDQDLIVHTAATGRDAHDHVLAETYGLVFLDVHLPDGNGLQILKEIKRVSPESQVVVISADGSEANAQEALAAGALRFVEKPFDMTEIHFLLETVYGSHAQKRRAARTPCRIPLRFRILHPPPNAGRHEPLLHQGTATELGEGGFRITTDHPLMRGQILTIEAEAQEESYPCRLPKGKWFEVRWVAVGDDKVTAGLAPAAD